MRRFNAMGMMLLLALTAMMGCQPNTPGSISSNDGYFVMFEGAPRLNTRAVYHQGLEIGEIVSAKAGVGNIVELKVVVDGEYKDMMTEEAVFYPSAGHLEYSRLSPAGKALEDGAPVLGFPSKLSYAWYRFKTVLSRPKAAEKAQRLQEKIQWAEPVEIAL